MKTNALRQPSPLHIAILLASICVLFALPATARAQTEGIITGTVTNQTTGAPVVDVEVTLSAFTSEGMIGEFSVMTDTEGRYVFHNVDVADGIVYAASVSHRGVLYSTGMIRFQGTSQQESAISVYEPTTDRSVLSINSRGIVLSELSPDEGEVTILDISSFVVDGNQTFVAGDTGRSIEFPVPRNAASVTPMPGFDFGTPAIENSVVYATSPLRPEGGSATLSYVVRYTGNGFTIDTRNAYPTGTFRILIPTDLTDSADAISVSASGFEDEGLTRIGDREYHVWGVTGLAQDTSSRITFGSLPQSAFEPNRLRVLEPALLAGLAVIVATGVTVLLLRRRRIVPAPVSDSEPAQAGFLDNRDELVMQLQKLQDEHENGLIDDELYLSERRSILERLRVVSRHLRDEPVPDLD